MRIAPLAAALALLPLSALAAPLTGVYKTESNEEGSYLEVTFGACESNAELTCGTITAAKDAADVAQADYEHLGRTMIEDMERDGNAFSGGTIWAPDDDKTYSSKMELSGDMLEVEGCVFFICRGQTWQAVN